MTLTGNNVKTLRKLTSKATAEKGVPLKLGFGTRIRGSGLRLGQS